MTTLNNIVNNLLSDYCETLDLAVNAKTDKMKRFYLNNLGRIKKDFQNNMIEINSVEAERQVNV